MSLDNDDGSDDGDDGAGEFEDRVNEQARGGGEMHHKGEKVQPTARKKNIGDCGHKPHPHECFFSLVANMQVHN